MNDFDAEFDDAYHGDFVDAGLAEGCSYRPKSGPAIDGVRCYVERGLSFAGELSSVSQRQVVIDLIKQPDLPRPVEGDVIALGVGGTELQRVDALQDEDESVYRVICARVRT